VSVTQKPELRLKFCWFPKWWILIGLQSSVCAIMVKACLRTRSKKFSSLSIELKMIAIAKPAGRALSIAARAVRLHHGSIQAS